MNGWLNGWVVMICSDMYVICSNSKEEMYVIISFKENSTLYFFHLGLVLDIYVKASQSILYVYC